MADQKNASDLVDLATCFDEMYPGCAFTLTEQTRKLWRRMPNPCTTEGALRWLKGVPPETMLSLLHESLGATPTERIFSDWEEQLGVVVNADWQLDHQILALVKDGDRMVWFERCTMQPGTTTTYLDYKGGWHFAGKLSFEEAWEESIRLAPDAKVLSGPYTVATTPEEKRQHGWLNKGSLVTARSPDGSNIKAIFLADSQFYRMEWRTS